MKIKLKLALILTLLIILFEIYAWNNTMFWSFYLSPILYFIFLICIISRKKEKTNIPKIYKPDHDYEYESFQDNSFNQFIQYSDKIERTTIETIYIK
jgi:hypothetical protein